MIIQSDKYYRNLQATQRNPEFSKKFQIRMPNLISKRLTKYKSWRNIDLSIERIDKDMKQINFNSNKFEKQQNKEMNTTNTSYFKFMKSFLKQKNPNQSNQSTIHNHQKSIDNFFHQKSAIDLYQHKTTTNTQYQQAEKDICTITVGIGQSASKIRYKVNSVQNLINFLKGKNNNIIMYKTIKKDLALDFALTLEKMNVSFLNGRYISLMPVYRQVQTNIDINSFQILQCIGTGGFSKVFLVRFLQDGQLYAMKVINKEFIVKHKKKNIVINQRNIMKQLNNHPFIVKMKFCFQSRESLIFVMEYCPGGQLFNLVKKFRKMKEEIAKFYIVEILLGLEKVHQERIIYRDFKPQNILLDLDGHIRIADFGLAKPSINTNKDRAFSFCGSPQYMPPQMIMKTGHSFGVDFYCIGALLYELVTGLPPFYDKDPNKIYQATVTQTLTFPSHAILSYQIRQLLQSLLEKNQKFRLGSLSGVKQVLAHPWFGKINRKDYLQKKITPPVKFSGIQDFNFTFDQIQDKNQYYVGDLKKQQKQENRKYQKIMGNFQYDYRQDEKTQENLMQKHYQIASSLKDLHSLKQVESLCSTRDTKRLYKNILTTRSKSGNLKFRRQKQPISMQNRRFINITSK